MGKISNILNTDSYKSSHFLQRPANIQRLSAYVESRGGKFPYTVFAGPQGFCKEYLCNPITREDIEEAEALLVPHGVPFNRKGWEYILTVHGGYLPLFIEAVPEGTIVPTRNVLLQATVSDINCAWLTTYVETPLLRSVWYPTTVATYSHACKQVIKHYMEKTAGHTDELNFKLLNFGARGVSSEESAAIGDFAHAINFQGSDCVSGILYVRRNYNEALSTYNIPAAEHSTITAWGVDGEVDAYRNMIKQFSRPGSVYAVVSDSYDLWNAIDNIWGGVLKDEVINSGGRLVVRPDSGDPVFVAPETIRRLMAKFGFTTNEKGYRVLPPFLRVVQGDGVTLESITEILDVMEKDKLSAENIAFGMGGQLLQSHSRDDQRFAMKASAIMTESGWKDIYKDPKTDPGKASKRGQLALVERNGVIQTIRASDRKPGEANLLRPIFYNGKLLIDDTLSNIRQRAGF